MDWRLGKETEYAEQWLVLGEYDRYAIDTSYIQWYSGNIITNQGEYYGYTNVIWLYEKCYR